MKRSYNFQGLGFMVSSAFPTESCQRCHGVSDKILAGCIPKERFCLLCDRSSVHKVVPVSEHIKEGLIQTNLGELRLSYIYIDSSQSG